VGRLEAEGGISRALISLAPAVERAILIGAPVKGSDGSRHLAEHLAELARLTDTAGAVVVGELTQRLERPHPATYLGKGKLDQLRDRIAETSATLLIFDDELTPAQGKNIEEATGLRALDRAELILDIFATRARSSEAKIQVELAQLEYLRTRLTRMWTHLEKFRGGIGVRGPGETQLETDRRLIGHRIKLLRERLDEVERARAIQRQGRRTEFRTSLVGYTNAGKSSILRGLSGAADVVVEDRLFATLDPLTRRITVPVGDNGAGPAHVLLTDTVGFIRKLPHHLVASFRATLQEMTEADQIVHVVDASHPAWQDQHAVGEQVLAELGAPPARVLTAFNKMDAIDETERDPFQLRALASHPNSVFVSAVEAHGLEPLRRALGRAVADRHRDAVEALAH
jgi:GTP-binding protein HflX